MAYNCVFRIFTSMRLYWLESDKVLLWVFLGFFALLPKYPFFFENWSIEGLPVLFLEEKGFKVFVTFVGLLKSTFFVTAVSTLIKYLHLAKLRQKLLTRRVVPRLFKCRPLLFNIPTLMFVLSTKHIFSSSHLRFSKLFTLFPFSFNVSFRTVRPDTDTLFFSFLINIAISIMSLVISSTDSLFWGCWFQRAIWLNQESCLLNIL